MKTALLIEAGSLVRSVVQGALAKDGWQVRATVAERALEESARCNPDLILMDAAQDAARLGPLLRETPNLQETPIVVMVAEASTAHWSEVSLADDAIRKPFGPDALRAMVANLSRRSSSPDRPRGTRAEAAALESALFAVASQLSSTQPGPTAQLILAREVADAYDAAQGLAFRGRVEHIPLGDVIQMLSQGHTGVLVVEHTPGVAVEVCFDSGRVSFVGSEGLGDYFLLGRYLVRHQFVAREDIEYASRRPTWLGRSLLDDGALSRDDLQQALREQSSERIYEALRWERATFRFERFRVPEEAREAQLEMPATMLLMEGLRRVDEWRLIEQRVPNFDVVFSKDLAVRHPEGLSDHEEQVLALVDGEHDVRSLIATTGLGAFDVCKTLYQLASSRLVREVFR